MTPDEQRAPKAFMKVYFDGRKELSLERPEESPDAGIVELVDRGLLMHFIGVAQVASDRIAAMNAGEDYWKVRHSLEMAEEEVQKAEDLIRVLENRVAEVRKLTGLKSS